MAFTVDEIVSVLERERANLSDEQIEVFVKFLGILNPINRRPILGKSVSDIERDAGYFKGLTARAAKLVRTR